MPDPEISIRTKGLLLELCKCLHLYSVCVQMREMKAQRSRGCASYTGLIHHLQLGEFRFWLTVRKICENGPDIPHRYIITVSPQDHHLFMKLLEKILQQYRKFQYDGNFCIPTKICNFNLLYHSFLFCRGSTEITCCKADLFLCNTNFLFSLSLLCI